MKKKIVVVPTVKNPIKASPGFAKKSLSEYKLDILALCEFGCGYCSSNEGNFLRINRAKFAKLTFDQIGERVLPSTDPDLMFLWPDILDQICSQLNHRPTTWGAGQTLVFSMLTDGFSPTLVKDGTTEAALRLLLDYTAFRIRVLTKNAIVGSQKWIDFFSQFPGRFVVGLSIGSLDDAWARRVEVGTPSPTARLRALRNLQDAGIPTYGMLCPVFPDMLASGQVERLIDQIRPDRVEHVWAEPYNDRTNWRVVRNSYSEGSMGHEWMTAVYERRERGRWSQYATELYERLRGHAEKNGWLEKLRYLLYEGLVTAEDAPRYSDLSGVLLQSKPADDGRSRNPNIAAIQAIRADRGIRAAIIAAKRAVKK